MAKLFSCLFLVVMALSMILATVTATPFHSVPSSRGHRRPTLPYPGTPPFNPNARRF